VKANFLIRQLSAAYDPSCWSNSEPDIEAAKHIQKLTTANRQLTAELALCKQQEHELRQALGAAIAANKTKAMFNRNMGHALRTPLNAIIGFSDVISNEIHGPAGYAKYVEYAKHINQAGLHLLQMIIELLDVTRIEAGEMKLNEDVIDLEDCIAGGLHMLERQAFDRRVSLSREIAGEFPLMYGDHARMKQIFINLIGNAIKFTPAGGSVRVNASVLCDGALRIIVADTGIGIAPGDLAKLCATCEQAPNTLASPHIGAWLASVKSADRTARRHTGNCQRSWARNNCHSYFPSQHQSNRPGGIV